MKKTIITSLILAIASMLYGIESVKILTTLKDNRVVSKEVKAKRIADNITQVVIPANEIDKNCRYFDVMADNAVAKKGDEGFWILNRGLLGYFNKDNGGYKASQAYMYLPYYAMKTPNETFIGIIDGMRFEFGVNVEVEDAFVKTVAAQSSTLNTNEPFTTAINDYRVNQLMADLILNGGVETAVAGLEAARAAE